MASASGFDVPSRREIFDYSHDGVMRSLEFSLERLGLDRVDVLYVHDLDIFTHGSEAAKAARLAEFMAGGYRALTRLRDQGVIAGFGAGVNEWEPCDWLLERGEFDLFLLAGRYTLLEQGAAGFMDRAHAKGVGVVIGGPYNSGILATGPRPGAHYNYAPAPEAVLDRAARLQSAVRSARCAAGRRGLPVSAAASGGRQRHSRRAGTGRDDQQHHGLGSPDPRSPVAGPVSRRVDPRNNPRSLTRLMERLRASLCLASGARRRAPTGSG